MRWSSIAAALLVASPVAAQPVVTLAPGETLLTIEARAKCGPGPT